MKEKVYCNKCHFGNFKYAISDCIMRIDTRVRNEYNNEVVSGTLIILTRKSNSCGTCEYYEPIRVNRDKNNG